MPQPGQILFYKDFEFPDDHSTKDKLFIILNNTDTDQLCLVLKTTSRPERYKGVEKGCNPKRKVFYVPLGWEQCFRTNTFIQIPQIFEISTEELSVGDITGRVRVTSSLTIECMKLLIDCLKLFKDDISSRHWRIIFRR